MRAEPNACGRGDAATLVVGTGLALWFTATALSQHPNRSFDRLRTLDPFGVVLPNWRFFAPEPARHDFGLLHRVLTADGRRTPWVETTSILPRRWSQVVWFPSRREDKALFDIYSRLLPVLAEDVEAAQDMYEYRMLSEFVERRVRTDYAEEELPQGFQFTLVKHGGYDESVTPEYVLVSEFKPLQPCVWCR